jgi:epoxyqueuosine reductase
VSAPDVELRDRVLAAGTGAGLEVVGTCSAEPFLVARRALEERKAAGLNGTMQFTYKNPARSTDPSATVEGCTTLVVAAARYPSEVPESPDRPAARVARYATDDHYGRLRAGLRVMADLLRDAGHRALVMADDNSVVDRAAAHRAGIGWYGKSANLLVPGEGSWFVLGSVLTTADLGESPEVVADGCGTCRRCIDGCPTGAIVAEGVVDARRCLAWLVQQAGEFPHEYREALGDRLYGCDECQEVCPPNRRADLADPTVMSPGAAPGPWVDVQWLLTAPDEELLDDATVGRWYIPKRDASVLRRNGIVVLGNLVHDGRAGPEALDLLVPFLEGSDPLLAEHAAWAARRGGRADLLPALPVRQDVADGPPT